MCISTSIHAADVKHGPRGQSAGGAGQGGVDFEVSAAAGPRKGCSRQPERSRSGRLPNAPGLLHAPVIGLPLCLQQNRSHGGHAMSSFSLYLLGILVLIGGLAYVAWLMHVPLQWIGAGVIVVFGLGILGAVKHTQRRDPPK